MKTTNLMKDGKHQKVELRQIEWMLKRKSAAKGSRISAPDYASPPYGDLTALNTSRLILDSLGKALLSEIVSDLLDMLETSCAVYEKNGDYALGIFSSTWCRFMDMSSQRRCGTSDLRDALSSGKWHCHESCWKEAALRAIQTGKATDVECRGGIRLFAVPIFAGKEIVGCISLGYGNPPRDPEKLRALAAAYDVSAAELLGLAEAYEMRPPFIIELAKRRAFTSALLIGEIVARYRTEAALRESEEKYRDLFETMEQGVVYQDSCGQIVVANPAAERILGLTFEQMQGRTSMDPRWRSIHEDGSEYPGDQHPAMIALRTGQPVYNKVMGVFHPLEQRYHWIIINAVPQFQRGNARPFQVYTTFADFTEREQAEAALRKSEEKFRSLVETTSDWVWEVDETGAYTYASPKIREILGYEPEEVIGKKPFDFMPAAEGKRLAQAFQEAVQARAPLFSLENINLHKNGHPVVIETSAVPIIESDGNLAGYRGIDRNVTQRKHVEAALKEASEFSQQIINNAREGIAVLDKELRYVLWNPFFAQLRSRSASEVMGKHPWEVFPYLKDYGIIDKFREALSGETVMMPDIPAQMSPEGKPIWTSGQLQPYRNADGDITGVIVLVRDITDRKLAEQALKESERRQKDILNGIPDLAWLKDAEGRFLAVNKAWSDFFGLEEEKVVGKTLFDVLPKEFTKRSQEEDHNVIASGKSICHDSIHYDIHGNAVWLEALKTPLFDEQGHAIGIIGISHDITERKRAEEERIKLEAQMLEVQKLESLGVLAGGIAHDFNNLLMAILGNADLALLSLSPASPSRANIEDIVRASQRAAELCRQMLAYSGKGRFVVGRYDLSEIVREMTQMLEISISKKALLRYSFAEKLPAVEIDATQMRQIIMNLITNASEAIGDASGVIAITTGVMECDCAYLSETCLHEKLPEGTYVYLEVSDTGCGMDSETMSRIFDPFFTTKFVGRGLGLAAVLGIVRGHNGTIKVYSEPGRGTTFKILLPAVSEGKDERMIAEAYDAPLPKDGTVLLVDDDADVRNVGSQMLELLGFQVLTAANGREALDVFRERGDELNCVILDLAMPEMSGEEAFRELRRLKGDMLVILSSGYNEQDVTQRFVGKGLAGFIQKPYTLDNLRKAINQALDRQ